ncbi:MAG: dihydroorotate dehydrogenase [Gammaproteobacteria bacterium]
MHNNLKTHFCGLELDSPIVLLSGCVGFGEEYTRIEGFSNTDVGAICLKGTTLEPRLGNIPSRVTETPEGMINAIGLQNPGTDIVINEIMPKLDKQETRFIINISGSSIEEYGEIAKRFDDSDIDAIEINISCPNVKEGGVAFGNDPDKPVALLKVHQVYQVSKKYNVPIIGQGGIMTANDAIEFIIAGASTVGIGTALFYDPLACPKINNGISQYLIDHQLNSIDELIGTLELNSAVSQCDISSK